MNNWDARDEKGKNCTIDEDLKSIEKTCKILEISKIHHVNYQSSYWQRVFSPVLAGYQSGACTPNPDILCNKEIKFGELYEWAVEGSGKADYLATGHYARIQKEIELRQALDLGKDQTYFLSAIDRICLKRTIFPVGNLIKSNLKIEILKEAGFNHLIDRKESMGLCFIGKRGRFQNFMSDFIHQSQPGPVINYETGIELNQQHKGLSYYTLGQNASLSGVKTRLYVAAKDLSKNALLVVDSLDHPALWTKYLKISKFHNFLDVSDAVKRSNIFCSIRSVDKNGIKIKNISKESNHLRVELEEAVFAPCSGQWAVFYSDDENAKTCGRLCLGGGPIL